MLLKDDTCIISIGFYTAHFTAYQPETRQSEQFCEDLPDTGLSVFVLDYLHASLKEVPVDFRIIRNTTGRGDFARADDIAAIDDIEAVTVAYHPPVVRRDARFEFEHTFLDRGKYVGIVTAGHPSKDKHYTSVFPFEVGARKYGWVIAFGIAIVTATAGLLIGKTRVGAARQRAEDHGS